MDERLTVGVGDYHVELLTTGGPRVTGCSLSDGSSLFAELPGVHADLPDGRRFDFVGGHRLWRTPEHPITTYVPDADPVDLQVEDSGIRLTGVPDDDGVVKTIVLSAAPDMIRVEHRLDHRGTSAVLTGAWGITQFRTGGVAIAPLANEPADDAGLLPNSTLAVWPYTDLSSPEIEFRRHEVLIHGSERVSKAKLGFQARRNWLAYVHGDVVFVKWAPDHVDSATYPDLGCSMEIYRDERFVELESLGPLVELAPGTSITHVEHWAIISRGARSLEQLIDDIGAMR